MTNKIKDKEKSEHHRSTGKNRRRIKSMWRVRTISVALTLLAVPFATAQQSESSSEQQNTEQQMAEPATAQETVAPDEQIKKSLQLNWSNTLKYSNAFRLAGRSATLIDPSRNSGNVNQDDGDRNFHGGLFSNRADLLSDLDVTYGNYGVRASMAAWADPTYNQRTANGSPLTYNPISANYGHFASGTKELLFEYAELLDAFAFAKMSIRNTELTLRGGQYAQFWGETLFFGNNGIAGGMAPIDAVKALSVPNSQFKELIRPVPQISGALQIRSNIAVGAYYQLGWEKHRLPPAGSYFSTLDILDDGGERFLAGTPVTMVPGGPVVTPAFWRGHDKQAENFGQFGVQLKVRPGHGYDLGFYAIQFHDKAPQIYIYPALYQPPDGPPVVLNPSNFNPRTGKIGSYLLAYHENIRAYGVSATKTIGIVNWAAEISGRTNMDLDSDGVAILPGVVADNKDHPLYAVGDSIHANVSALASFGPSFISREASLLAEVAWNRLLSITHNPSALDPDATRDAVGMQATYSPTYHQVRSGLDLSPQFGISFYPRGKSAVISNFGPNHGGTLSLGLNAIYTDYWRVGIAYNQFYGHAGGTLNESNQFTFGQSLADRNFISFSVYRTFGMKTGKGKAK